MGAREGLVSLGNEEQMRLRNGLHTQPRKTKQRERERERERGGCEIVGAGKARGFAKGFLTY